jgi:hypothetical protein
MRAGTSKRNWLLSGAWFSGTRSTACGLKALAGSGKERAVTVGVFVKVGLSEKQLPLASADFMNRYVRFGGHVRQSSVLGSFKE